MRKHTRTGKSKANKPTERSRVSHDKLLVRKRKRKVQVNDINAWLSTYESMMIRERDFWKHRKSVNERKDYGGSNYEGEEE